MKKIIKILTSPIPMNHWVPDLVFASTRFLCGMLLALSFGADKFGVSWTADH